MQPAKTREEAVVKVNELAPSGYWIKWQNVNESLFSATVTRARQRVRQLEVEADPGPKSVSPI
jgi:hypothetical protein